uniref:Uncharacterized protein n=1 Tax=Anguilla anguilla TaxID=7936 RepID=A0A0E9QLM2_ANGAN
MKICGLLTKIWTTYDWTLTFFCLKLYFSFALCNHYH